MHPALELYSWTEHGLQIGGRPAERLAAEAGTTPLFVYDRALLRERVQTLRATLPDDLGLNYAIKANPMPALASFMRAHVDGFDVASAGEMRVALDAGMPRDDVSFAGPGKTDDELRRAIAAGIIIELESAGELERAADISERLGVRPNLAVRVNPDFGVKSSGMQMGGGPQQFGVDAEAVPALLKRLGERGARFHGFHVFPGSQNLRAEVLAEACERIGALVEELSRSAPEPPPRINLGGGFGIPYFPNEKRLDVTTLAHALEGTCQRLRQAFPGASLRMELGRYLVGEAGVYLTRIVDRKISRGQTYLVTDGGLHHQLAASGNFGQRIRRNFPVAAASPPRGADETVSVVGCLCTPIDLLGDNVTLPGLAPGDLVAIFQAGAYGLTASPTAFLGHPPPAELLV